MGNTWSSPFLSLKKLHVEGIQVGIVVTGLQYDKYSGNVRVRKVFLGKMMVA